MIASDFEMASLVPKPRPICRNWTVYIGEILMDNLEQDLPTYLPKRLTDQGKPFSWCTQAHHWGRLGQRKCSHFPAKKRTAAHASVICFEEFIDLLQVVWSRAGTRYECWEHCRPAIVASTLSSLDSFSSPIRKKYLTPSHLKLTDLTPSRIISPRLISPHLIITYLTSSHLIVTLFPWSRLTLCRLTLSYFTVPHVMTSKSHLTSSHLEIGPGIHHRISKKRRILCTEKPAKLTDLSTKRSKINLSHDHHSLINVHGRASACKKRIPAHPYQCWL